MNTIQTGEQYSLPGQYVEKTDGWQLYKTDTSQKLKVYNN